MAAEEGQVISCHTIDQWKEQFEKGKESKKLVNYYYCYYYFILLYREFLISIFHFFFFSPFGNKPYPIFSVA